MWCYSLRGLGVSKGELFNLIWAITNFIQGPVTIYHTQSERLRAIENGFTLFRCTTYGLSGIYGPTYNVVYDQVVATYPTETYLFYLPIRKRVATLYGYIGDSFSYLTVLITFVAFILLIRQKYKSNQLFI